MQLGFKSNLNFSETQKGPFSNMDNAVMSIANNGRIATSIVIGAAASAKSLLERKEAIDYFEKNRTKIPNITNGLQGKELVKHLTDKKMINSLPKAIIFPFAFFSALTLLTLNLLNRTYPQKQN